MSAHLPSGSTAVMARRVEPPDSLDFFPTPPWATRALMVHVLGKIYSPLSFCGWTALDPACGEGHMVEPLREYFGQVFASDVFDYGRGYPVADFLDRTHPLPRVDWIIINPPFNAAADFARRALDSAGHRGLAIFQRLAWIEGGDRHKALFSKRPPHFIAPFAERVPLHKGVWKPDGDSATAYAWFVWVRGMPYAPGETRVRWIPPTCRAELHLQADVIRWCPPAPMPLFEGEP